jgi:hypothetical protein
VYEHISSPAQNIIEISPAPDLYAVEFSFPHSLGITVILPATCALSAKLEVRRLFPEYQRNASAISLFNVEYAEIDWETGRCFVKKRQKRAPIPRFALEEPKTRRQMNKRDEEGSA